MHNWSFSVFADENHNLVMIFDDEAIDRFIQGLEQLRMCAPGEQLVAASVSTNGDSDSEDMAQIILRRWEESEDE
jgi:hypothetical protein